MPSINMISPRRAEKRRLESNVRRLLMVILGEVVLTIVVVTYLVTRIYSTQSQVADLSAKINQYQPTVNRIQNYEKATTELKPKLDTLNQAKSDTLLWRRVMDNLSACLPEKTWLTRLATQMPADSKSPDITVSLNGTSASQELVGEAMLRMQRGVRDFEKVELHFTQKSFAGAQNAVDFEVAAAVKLQQQEDSKKGVEKS
jgi:Tfp pilus assembly protein PilN